MNQITIDSILQKIRVICRESSLTHVPERPNNHDKSAYFESYMRSLETIRGEFVKYRNIEQEYNKLELLLQRQETEIRKKIGVSIVAMQVEQQLKLYTDALKLQVEELEKQKLELLENSKAYIKQLKKTNENLYSQLHASTHKKNKSKEGSPQKTEKSKINKSLSQHKTKQDRSIREIIKTEYIQRDKSNSGNKRKAKKGQKFGIYSTISGHEASQNINENAKTFQVVYSNSGKKQKPVATNSRKKNNHLFSNYTLLNFLDTSNKKLKKEDKSTNFLTKSPAKKEKKKQGVKSRVQNASKALWKEKKANKSVFSLSSLQPNLNNKDTL